MNKRIKKKWYYNRECFGHYKDYKWCMRELEKMIDVPKEYLKDKKNYKKLGFKRYSWYLGAVYRKYCDDTRYLDQVINDRIQLINVTTNSANYIRNGDDNEKEIKKETEEKA